MIVTWLHDVSSGDLSCTSSVFGVGLCVHVWRGQVKQNVFLCVINVIQIVNF